MDKDIAIDFILGGDETEADDRALLDADDTPLGSPKTVNGTKQDTRRRVSMSLRSHRERPCALDRYFAELRTHPTLDNKEKQLALARRIRAAKAEGRPEEARELEEKFFLGQLRIGVSIASKSRKSGVELEDRIQYANMGLLGAARKFDPAKGCTFFTYSKWKVRRSIQQGDENTGRTIRLPSHIIESLRKLDNAVRRHERKFGETPTAEQIAEDMGISVAKVNGLLAVRGREALTILDAVEHGESEAFLHKSLGAEQTTPEEVAIERDIVRKLSAAVDRLGERQVRVIKLFYGLETGVPLDLQEVANAIGVSYNTARSDRDKAFRALRDMGEVGDLRDAS